jgi:hypothetical protein
MLILQVEFQKSISSLGMISNNFLSLSLIGNVSEVFQTKTEYFLIIDCSGSMSGSSIKIACETLSVFL